MIWFPLLGLQGCIANGTVGPLRVVVAEYHWNKVLAWGDYIPATVQYDVSDGGLAGSSFEPWDQVIAWNSLEIVRIEWWWKAIAVLIVVAE